MFASAGIAKAAPPGADVGRDIESWESCLQVGESFICMPLLVELDLEAVTTNAPVSILDDDQLLTIYGKSLCLAPVMGILGRYCSMEEMVEATLPLAEGLDAANGDRGVRLAAHVVYGMARPCWGPGDSCLMYLEEHGFDIVGEYIEPAAELGVEVVLDVQMGRSTPLLEIERMIDLGYLAYPNVHIALDPEFATGANQVLPGSPIGRLDALSINEGLRRLDDYLREIESPTRRVVMLHQFIDESTDSWTMIPNKELIETFEYLDVTLVMDGFGGRDIKVLKYNALTDAERYPWISRRSIKLFLPNPWSPSHQDFPVLTWPQVVGTEPTPGGYLMEQVPDVVVVA
jgi:hypothetical protein